MKRLIPLPLASLLLAGCMDRPTPTEPLAAPEVQAPAFALIVHGVTELPTLGGTFSWARGINDFGQVVGTSTIGSGEDRAFLWQNGSMQDLGTLGGTATTANGVNDLGQVVGTSRNSAGEDRAFLWQNGSMQDLGTLGGTLSLARGVNNPGQVVGSSLNSSGQERAFLWQNGGMQDLGTLGGTFSTAWGVNDLGQVVGSSRDGSGEQRPFLWQNGSMQDLGTLGGTLGSARGVNGLGQVVGMSRNGSGRDRAFLWQNGSMQDLGTLGGTLSSAQSVNDLGQVVGWSSNSSGVLRAFLWMDGTMFSLGGLGSSGGYSRAYGINNHGQVTGEVVNEGEWRGVVWNVPIRPPVDIEPGDATNTIRLSKGGNSVTVAILGSRYFKAQTVDAATVTLGDEQGTDTPVARKRNGQPEAVLKDVDRDGHPDLVLTFSKNAMDTNGDLGSATSRLVLLGRRTDGRALRAVEPVNAVQ